MSTTMMSPVSTSASPGARRPARPDAAVGRGSELRRKACRVGGAARPLLARRRPVQVPLPAAVRPASTGLRLTGRGRLLMLVVMVALLLGAFAAGHAASGASEQVQRPTPAVPAVRVVAQGDTLWTIARELAPRRDPRDVVDQIQRLNGLHGGALRIGQQLVLPVAS